MIFIVYLDLLSFGLGAGVEPIKTTSSFGDVFTFWRLELLKFWLTDEVEADLAVVDVVAFDVAVFNICLVI